MSGLPSWAKVGARVVCVNDGWTTDPSPLSKGAVYTVVGIASDFAKHGEFAGLGTCPTFLLKETKNPTLGNGFNIARFRPLVTRSLEQDIAQFIPLLTPSKEV
jgi:hypothetical protein